MDEEFAERLITALETEKAPIKFDMVVFCDSDGCKTVGCIAGTAVALADGADALRNMHLSDIARRAAELLDLEPGEATQHLFLAYEHQSLLRHVTAQQAAKALQRLVDGIPYEEIWDGIMERSHAV